LSEPLIPRLTTSERISWARCPQQWWWNYREGWTPRTPDRGARWFGTGVHEVLAQWYGEGKRRGLRPDVAFARWIGDERDSWIRSSVTDDFDDDIFVGAGELGEAMLLSYYKTYGRDEKLDIVATEQFGEVLVSQADSDASEPLALYSFVFDGVLYWEGELLLLEHKSAARIVTAHLPHDEQAGSYSLFAEYLLRQMGILGKKDKISGILYNFLRKGMPDTRPRSPGGAYLNQNGTVSKRQPAPFFVREPVERSRGERRSILSNIQNEAEIMLAQRNGELPLWKNRTRECTYCDFFDLCKLNDDDPSPDGAWTEFADAMFVRRDPYAYQDKKTASAD
jgi:hypothetical protein